MNRPTIGKIILFTGLAFAICGCTTLPPLNTPSGKPEITIPAEKTETAVNMLINWMVSSQYGIETQTKQSITFSRPLSGWEATATLIGIGNSYSTNPTRHAQFSIVTIGRNCRIILSRYWDTCENYGGRTGTMEVKNRNYIQGFQNYLEYISREISPIKTAL